MFAFKRFLLIISLVCMPMLAMADKLDINTADAAALSSTMTGVGSSRAEAIVAYRKAHGKFASVDDLSAVKGIGKATIEKNRDKIAAIKAAK